MPLRITTLSENTAGIPGVIAEWGLSVLVDTGELKILFDTGASSSVPHNVRLFGVDLSEIDRIALSHGHFDHTGGLPDVLDVCDDVSVYAHPAALEPKYKRRADGLPSQCESHS